MVISFWEKGCWLAIPSFIPTVCPILSFSFTTTITYFLLQSIDCFFPRKKVSTGPICFFFFSGKSSPLQIFFMLFSFIHFLFGGLPIGLLGGKGGILMCFQENMITWADWEDSICNFLSSFGWVVIFWSGLMFWVLGRRFFLSLFLFFSSWQLPFSFC